MASPVVLILGAGPGIGQHSATLFSANGYKVAVASRSKQDRLVSDKTLEIKADLSDPRSVSACFSKVKEAWGWPNVVIYNGASRTVLDGEDPLSSFSFDQYEDDMAVNVTSALLAAKFAVAGFKELPASTLKTFIYTGNKLNAMSIPEVMCFGMGKAAIAHMIWDASIVYEKQGFRFYYTNENLEDGSPAKLDMDPATSAELYLRLAGNEKKGPWQYTHVKGKGYVDFRELDMKTYS